MHSNIHNKLDKAMTTEQFTQVVDAILAGKYSWACVLILRFAGYNPLHYIPYRTYNRLMKENCSVHRKQRRGDETMDVSDRHHALPSGHANKITDLSYLEPINEQRSKIRGGSCSLDFSGDSIRYPYRLSSSSLN